MRPLVESRFGSPRQPLPWNDVARRPASGMEIEVDLGDARVWNGVRYLRDADCFVDVESAEPVRIRRWRYSRSQAAA